MYIDYIISRLKKEEDIPLLKKAYDFVKEKLLGLDDTNKDALINRILGVTNTLIDFNADCLTLISSILYETINYGVSKDEIEKEFGITIANIALGISNINKFETTGDSENNVRYLNELRADSPVDVRIMFIKLAMRLYDMKKMDTYPVEYQKKVAQETLDILVPMASKIGLNYIKSKLEDLCLYYLKPEEYNDILKKLNDEPSVLNMYLNDMKESISDLLSENDIKFKIKGRVKNIYSIYNKLCSGKNWEDIYDILAIRILVENEYECNLVAELIHSKYTPIPSRIKDYITFPKDNMYQSLHTTIVGEDGRFYEIQIRTYEMNKVAEKGNASHHLYKEKKLKKHINSK